MVRCLRLSFLIAFACVLGVCTAWAQEASSFRFSGVAISGTYSSQDLPPGFTTFEDVALGTASSITASTDMAWHKGGAKRSMNAAYGSLFGVRLQQNGLKSWNHSGSAGVSTKFGRRWALSASGSGGISTFDESIFAASRLATVAATNASFGDLSNALLEGTSNDPELANAGRLRPDLAQERFLFGRRTAAVGTEVGLSYAASRRLSYGVNVGLNQTRHLNDATDLVGFEYPQAVSVGIDTGVKYSLSPKTQIGGDVTVVRGGTSLQNLQNRGMSARIGLSRTLRRRWFFDLSGGAGTDNAKPGANLNFNYSIGVGFVTTAHTFLVSYAHQIEDPYVVALGGGTNADAMSAAWHWSPFRSKWSVTGSYSDARAHFIGLSTVASSGGNFSIGRGLGEHFRATAEYSVGRLGSKRYVVEGRRYQLDQTGFRVTFNWSPSTTRIRR